MLHLRNNSKHFDHSTLWNQTGLDLSNLNRSVHLHSDPSMQHEYYKNKCHTVRLILSSSVILRYYRFITCICTDGNLGLTVFTGLIVINFQGIATC